MSEKFTKKEANEAMDSVVGEKEKKARRLCEKIEREALRSLISVAETRDRNEQEFSNLSKEEQLEKLKSDFSKCEESVNEAILNEIKELDIIDLEYVVIVFAKLKMAMKLDQIQDSIEDIFASVLQAVSSNEPVN